jgi:hypothetical protein
MLLDSDRKLVACVLSRCSRRLFYRHVQYHVIGTNLTERAAVLVRATARSGDRRSHITFSHVMVRVLIVPVSGSTDGVVDR